MHAEPLSLTAQTAFAQVLEAALASDHLRSVADLPGAFAAKTVKGHKYWYFQYTEPAGIRRQVFVGPDNDAVRRLMEKAAEPAAGTSTAPLVRAAAVLGCAEILPRHFRVLKRLAEYGFFKAGGVLIGTHAFVAYGNMLGVRWGTADAACTQDIDFAHAGKSISLALAPHCQVQTHEAIQSLEMGFLPISGLAGKTGGAYLIPREKEFRLDFLTTVGRSGETPYEHPDLHVTLQPLRFMEYSLENVQQTVLLSGADAVIVNLPHPARYALHKLIVAGEREGAFQAKTGKDFVQAGLLLSVLRENRPWEVEEA
ncbi:MAG TPA: nucleotidyltransferase domain-containing protein, partial [Azonexus sp.]|nr:nucleotidyltransferase domain-containing protein [Azonexus sp.]